MSDLLSQIDSEVRAGLMNEQGRIKNAYDNRRFADGCFEEYPTREENSQYSRLDYRRTSEIMSRIIDDLTSHLYSSSPSRQLAGQPKATEWLERVYRRNAMLPKWQEADRLTHIGNVAAFQFAGDTDPLCPVKIHLWGADQLVWWLDPDDQTKPSAVGTRDTYDGQTRLTIWTEDVKRIYVTAKQGVTSTAGGTAYKLLSEVDNPYLVGDGADAHGVIPFSFVHFKFPTTDFHTSGPGNSLRRLNDYVNFDLDDIGDGKRYLSKPIEVATGVDPGWSAPAQIKPGMWIRLEGHSIDAMGNIIVPTLNSTARDTTWIAANWQDLQSYIDHSLLMHGVPPGTFRLQASATSGVQVIAEQLPLIKLAEKRRIPFAFYESEAARICMIVGGAHLQGNGHGAAYREAGLRAASEDPQLSLRWPNLYTLLPGPEKNDDDTYRVDGQFASKVEILMQREDITREQAIERFAQIQRDNAQLLKLGIDPRITPLPAPPALAATT